MKTKEVEAEKKVNFMLYDVPEEDFLEFKEFTKKHCGNKFFMSLRVLLDAWKVFNILEVFGERLNSFEERISALEKKPEERKVVKTMGGEFDVETGKFSRKRKDS